MKIKSSRPNSCGCHCGCEHHEHDHVHENHQTKTAAQAGFKAQDPNKGVSLGPEVEADIAAALAKRYKNYLSKDERFTVKTEVCHHFGLVSSELTNPGRTTQVCVEVSVETEENQIENPMDAYTKALDVLDLIWRDYFDSDRVTHYLPIWQSYEIDNIHVNARLEHSNPALDDEASAFLRAHGFTEGGLEPEPIDIDVD